MNFCCKRCSYKSIRFNDILKHVNRKKTCDKNLEAYNYSEEEIIKLSLLPYYNDKHDFDYKLLKNNNKNIISKDKLTELLNTIYKNKLKECPLCNENYDKINDLKKHLILECISLDISDKNKESKINFIDKLENNINIISNNNSNNNNSNNILNINNTNNVTNNIIVQPPVSFDENWDISHLCNSEKNLLIISMYKYTKTLEYLLKNKNNHNVIIDKASNSGLVYKNNTIEKMSLDKICDESFDKLYDHLNSLYENLDTINIGDIDPEYIKLQKKSMKLKYFNYKNKEDHNKKKVANESFVKIFDKVKDQTIDNLNKIGMNTDIVGY
jgi:hypothetical protein